MPPLRRSLWLRRRCRPRHTIGVRAARGIRSRALLAFAPCPPACPRWRRWRRGRGAKGCAPVAAGSLRPPCCRLRPSFAGSGGGWSLGGALAIKKGANVARVPSLPARRRARARVRLRGKQRWGGLLAPSGGCAAAAPPPPPPVKCWGRGLWLSCVRCGGVAPAAAGARSSRGLSLGIIVHTLRKMVGGNRHTLRVGYKG